MFVEEEKVKKAPKKKESTFLPPDNTDEKSRQGNNVEDFNDLPAESFVEPEQKVVEQPKESYFDKLMNTRPPRPTLDKERVVDYRRLAKNNAIAKGINLLGDTIALGAGANVNRRAPDNKEAVYTNQIHKYLDDYTKRLDDWDWRDFAYRVRTLDKEQAQSNADRAFDANENYRERQDKRWDAQEENRKKLTDAQIRQRDEEIKAKKEYNRIRENYYKDLEQHRGNVTKPVRVATRSGKTYSYSPEQASLVRNEALRNSEILYEKYPQLFTKTEIMRDDGTEKHPTGEFTYEPKKTTKDEDLIRAYIEYQEEQAEKQAKGEQGGASAGFPANVATDPEQMPERLKGKNEEVKDPFDF